MNDWLSFGLSILLLPLLIIFVLMGAAWYVGAWAWFLSFFLPDRWANRFRRRR